MVEKKQKRQRQARQARLAIVQALYQAHQSDVSLKEVAAQFLERGAPELGLDADGADKEQVALVEKLDIPLFRRGIEKVDKMRSDIEGFTQNALPEGKSLERLDPLLQVILLAGGAELLIGKAPAAVVISEYVDVSHGFFEGSEPTLINGVLDAVAKAISL
ncbi:MAG: transcription antitermination protein NusB [bacterium]|nr:transcription antitermination protein NusB [bacterium]